MRRHIVIGLGALLTMVAFPASGQRALGAQRSRPTRIRFTPGASSSTVSGTLLPGQPSRMYVLRASAGQTLSFALSRTNPQVGAVVWDVNPDAVEGAMPIDESVYQPVRTASVTLPFSGDYFVEVSLADRSRKPKSPVKFSLTVEIR